MIADNELSSSTKTFTNMTQANFNGIDSTRFNMMTEKDISKENKIDVENNINDINK